MVAAWPIKIKKQPCLHARDVLQTLVHFERPTKNVFPINQASFIPSCSFIRYYSLLEAWIKNWLISSLHQRPINRPLVASSYSQIIHKNESNQKVHHRFNFLPHFVWCSSTFSTHCYSIRSNLRKWALSIFAFQSFKGFIETLNKNIFLIRARDFCDNPIYPLLSTWISTWTEPETYFG